METESVTREEFEALSTGGKGRVPLPETVKVLALAVDVGERFKNHKHITTPSSPYMCNLGRTIQRTVQAYGMQVANRHDGPDLIVFRLK